MKSFFIFVVTLISAVTVGCQPKNYQERSAAPAGPHDLGILAEVKSPTDVAKILRAHPGAQVRRLYPRSGLYEFFGVRESEIASALPDARLSANEFFTFKPNSMPGPEGVELKGLNRCEEGDTYPTATLTILGPDKPASGALTIELGSSLRISARESAAHIRSTFVVISPSLAPTPEAQIPGDEIELKPETLGVTHVFLVVQDARNVCAMDVLQVLVTANRPFAPRAPVAPIDLSPLTHLTTLSAESSWELSEGLGQMIAIVDSGVDYNHPFLAGNIALNTGETAANGFDDDQNGVVDDVIGYDFVNADPFPFDDDGHGTHVAGLAAATQFGLARKAKILPVKAMTSVGGDIGTVSAAIRYAVDRGANIINLSLGSMLEHPTLKAAIGYAEKNKVLVVVAAGNGDPMSGLGYDIDQIPIYPAAYEYENVVAVAASDSINPLAPYSNFGARRVDVVAPGGGGSKDPIYSAALENAVGTDLFGLFGTSMAAPSVSGIAAQIWAANPDLSIFELKQILIEAGEEVPALKPVTVSGRKINARSALEIAKSHIHVSL